MRVHAGAAVPIRSTNQSRYQPIACPPNPHQLPSDQVVAAAGGTLDVLSGQDSPKQILKELLQHGVDADEGQQHGGQQQQRKPEPPPVPGDGKSGRWSWGPVWGRTPASVFWRGLQLLDGAVGKEADVEQRQRDRIVGLFEAVAAANEELPAGQASRHELFLVGVDGRASSSLFLLLLLSSCPYVWE